MKSTGIAPLVPFALLILLAGAGAHADPAQTIHATELQAQAQSDAATLATLPQKTRVDVLRRSGAWSEVKTAGGQSGWVRMLSLRLDAGTARAAPGSPNSSGALSGLLSSGRTSNTATVTTGVRGLTEEDLRNAQANPAELEKMQKYATGKGAAQAFAQRSKLAPVRLEYLPETAPMRAESSPMDGG